MACSLCGYTVTTYVMPDFEPNEYLFEKHSDKGGERWEIYAWAVRDAMAKAGNFLKDDITLKAKYNYEKYMNYNRDSFLPDQ